MAILTKKSDTAEKKEPAAKVQVAGGAKVFAEILLQPRISEKSSQSVSLNKYVFNVLMSANKIEVKKAVEKVYHVKVVRVNMIKVKGKSRNFGRSKGRTSDFKKAMVTLKKGDKIEGVTETI
jgi:large subunit ribosomal protein L23